MNGFFLIDKPGGMTSHDVVARARRVLDLKKIGHAGTLDPMATGLLVLAAGRYTRLIRFVQDIDKEYVTRIQFGVATDTLDADGAVLSREAMQFERPDLEGLLPRFLGTVHQVPPMVSALKVGGRRLYDIAREGREVEREPRPVEIHELELIEFVPGGYPEAVLRVRCGKGTYIRSLAADLGQALGGHASVLELRRTASGPMSAETAIDIDEFESSADPWSLAAPVVDVLASLPFSRVDEATAVAVRNGVRLISTAIVDAPPEGWTAVVDPGSTLLAVYRIEGRQAVPEVVVA